MSVSPMVRVERYVGPRITRFSCWICVMILRRSVLGAKSLMLIQGWLRRSVERAYWRSMIRTLRKPVAGRDRRAEGSTREEGSLERLLQLRGDVGEVILHAPLAAPHEHNGNDQEIRILLREVAQLDLALGRLKSPLALDVLDVQEDGPTRP